MTIHCAMCDRGVARCYARYLALAVAVPVLFAAFLLLGAKPLFDLDARMQNAPCTVVGTATVAEETSPEGLYLPGIVVDFTPRNKMPVVNAIALAYVEVGRSWMGSRQRDAFWAAHPLGSTVICYYDPEGPRERVAVRPGVDLTGSVWRVFAASSAYAIPAALMIVALILFACLAAALRCWACICRSYPGRDPLWNRKRHGMESLGASGPSVRP